MEELPVPRKVIIHRLKRVAGQVRGCARMVEREAECPDILIQMAAARAALSATAALVLTNYTHLCMEKERREGEEAHAPLARALALWVGGTAEAPVPKVIRRTGRSSKVKSR